MYCAFGTLATVSVLPSQCAARPIGPPTVRQVVGQTQSTDSKAGLCLLSVEPLMWRYVQAEPFQVAAANPACQLLPFQRCVLRPALFGPTATHHVALVHDTANAIGFVVPTTAGRRKVPFE
jgi:hypothetical protein